MISKKESVCYESDASRLSGKPEKAIMPKTLSEVQSIVRANNIDIVPRGSGTGLSGGAVPNNSLVIDMSGMNKVTNFSPSKKTVHVESGITLKELNERLNPYFLEFPIDPANKGVSTIGGMIATNCSGDRSMRYGTIRDWIEEIEYINGRGELMKTSKADLMDICGMEGITGIIIGATIKLAPIIKRSASAFQTNNLDELLSIARTLKSEKEVVILELFSPLVSKFLGLPEKYNLIIEFNSDRGKIKGQDYDEIIKFRENIYFSIYKEGYYNSEDPKLFFDKLKEFMMYLDDNQIPYIGHLGAGVIIPFFKDNEKNKREAAIEFIKKIKGTPGKYGIGLLKKSFIEPFQAKMIQRVKVRYDPFLKLNKGKVIDINEEYVSKRYKSKKTLQENKDISGEDITAKEVIKEIEKEEKTPEKKIDEIIEEAKTPEEKMNRLIEVAKEEEIKLNVEKEEDIENKDLKFASSKEYSENEVKTRINDYEKTFKSELTDEKKHAVEEIAKNIPRDIVKREKNNLVDYREIQNIMTGKSSGFSNSPVSRGKIIVNDNLDRKSENLDDKELIDRIMGNKSKNGDNKNAS